MGGGGGYVKVPLALATTHASANVSMALWKSMAAATHLSGWPPGAPVRC